MCCDESACNTTVPTTESEMFPELARDMHAPKAPLLPVPEVPNMYRAHLEHRRSGHLHDSTVNARLRLEGKTRIRAVSKGSRCAICAMSNAQRANISRGSAEHPQPPVCTCSLCMSAREAGTRYSTACGQSVSMDLAGPFKEKTLGGHQYAVIMVDHFSR